MDAVDAVDVVIAVAMVAKIIVLGVVISVVETVGIVVCLTVAVRFCSIAKKGLIWDVVFGIFAVFQCEYYLLCS